MGEKTVILGALPPRLRYRFPDSSSSNSRWLGWLGSLRTLRAFLTHPGVLGGGKPISADPLSCPLTTLYGFGPCSSRTWCDAPWQDALRCASEEGPRDLGPQAKLFQPPVDPQERNAVNLFHSRPIDGVLSLSLPPEVHQKLHGLVGVDERGCCVWLY